MLGRSATPSCPMEAFNCLSVLISLILGLAITQVLKGFRGLMQSRARLKSYWPAVPWAILIVVIVVIAVRSWWSMYGLGHHEGWTFLAFAAVLAQTIVLYLLAAPVLPDFFGDAAVDLREHYDGHRTWFFALLVLLIVASIGKQLALVGALPPPTDLVFRLAFAAMGASGIAIARPRWQEFLAVAAALVIGAYIALLFTRLD